MLCLCYDVIVLCLCYDVIVLCLCYDVIMLCYDVIVLFMMSSCCVYVMMSLCCVYVMMSLCYVMMSLSPCSGTDWSLPSPSQKETSRDAGRPQRVPSCYGPCDPSGGLPDRGTVLPPEQGLVG